ncbi:hypothetical protein CBS101457_006345 [Exobasidium rhododendri]|nr:hypothetical protein CBS101457_006345 [Exobasidium rhododendri]
MSYPSESLQPLLKSIAELLVESSTTVSIAESTSGMFLPTSRTTPESLKACPLPPPSCTHIATKGGLVSAALLSVEGAASWYKGGTVLYTLEARSEFCGWTEEDTKDYHGPTEDVASKLALGVKERLNSTYCIGEAGVAGPISRVRSLPPGLTCLSIARDDGPPVTKTIMTGSRDRLLNMHAFAHEALKLLEEVLLKSKQESRL